MKNSFLNYLIIIFIYSLLDWILRNNRLLLSLSFDHIYIIASPRMYTSILPHFKWLVAFSSEKKRTRIHLVLPHLSNIFFFAQQTSVFTFHSEATFMQKLRSEG